MYKSLQPLFTKILKLQKYVSSILNPVLFTSMSNSLLLPCFPCWCIAAHLGRTYKSVGYCETIGRRPETPAPWLYRRSKTPQGTFKGADVVIATDECPCFWDLMFNGTSDVMFYVLLYHHILQNPFRLN